jgi:hypothetical protein
MKISNLSDVIPSTVNPKNGPNGAIGKDATISPDTPTSSVESAATVTISEKAKELAAAADADAASKNGNPDGTAIMLKRLYGVDKPQAAPMETRVTSDNIAMSDVVFLTQDDRKVLASAYQYAADNDIDPEQVDHLARDMGEYRFLSLTGGNFEKKDGEFWNTDGSPLYMKMMPSDSELAKKMLTSDDINNTTLDHGFLAFELNPRANGWTDDTNRGHVTDFAFLQKLISATSPGGGTAVDNNSEADGSSKQSSPISAAFANALDRINNQDKPLLPPPDWKVPQTGTSNDTNDNDTTSDPANLKEAISKFLQAANPSEDQFKQITAMFPVQMKIRPHTPGDKPDELSFFAQHLLDQARTQRGDLAPGVYNAVINNAKSASHS